MRKAFWTLGFVLVLVSCDETPAGPEPIAELPRQLTAEEVAAVRAGNDFAFRLFRSLTRAAPDSNVLISPISISFALGMALTGADGSTLEQMKVALGLSPLTVEEINRSYSGLMALLLGLDRSVDMRIANSMWFREGFPVGPEFVATNREVFDAEVATLDFASPEAVKAINDWVRENTNGRIEKIIESIPPDYVFYLINAIYFRGLWTYPFDPERTREAPFHRLDGTTEPVPLMGRDSLYVYLETHRYRAVEVPYGGEAFAMTVVLPAEGTTPAELMSDFDAADWEILVTGLTSERLVLSLPRFELEYERKLNEILAELGMPEAFTPAADFSRLSPVGVWIDEVRHKTFVRVDEEGTEAAAVTSVAGPTSAPPAFRADRPFVFVIRERFSGTILFIGQLVDPEG